MLKIFRYIFCFLFILSILFLNDFNKNEYKTFAAGKKVQEIFSDIDDNYKYLDELQALYDRGMIIPDKDGKFNPQNLLNRDEFVGISMQVICRECIVPNTPDYLKAKYDNTKPFFDVSGTNDYFYCIADAKDNDFVRGYDNSYVCQDGMTKEGQVPFCINNKITLEEAIAVLLRNSGIFTIPENEQTIADIASGRITDKISNDVGPTNSDGSPYTFYGYLEKALNFNIIDYDNYGNKKEFVLLSKDSNGNLNPKKNVTKEEFLYLSYIITRANSCSLKNYDEEQKDNNKYDIDTQIKIYDEVCKTGESDYMNVGNQKGNYAFNGVANSTQSGTLTYNWEFINKNTGEKLIAKGACVPGYSFPSNGVWQINLYVIDADNNMGKASSTLYINDGGGNNNGNNGGNNNGSNGGNNGGNNGGDNNGNNGSNNTKISVVINGDPLSGYGPLKPNFTSIVSGGDGNYKYSWDFGDGQTSDKKDSTNTFATPGSYQVVLTVTDGNGDTSTASLTVKVLEGGKCGTRCECGEGYVCSTQVIGECSISGVCLKDTDKDGIYDDVDKCPFIYGVASNGGCPIISESCSTNSDCKSGYSCASNGYCEPTVETVSYCSVPASKSSIFGNMMCNSCPCAYDLDFVASVRKCDVLFPSIVSPDGKDIYSKGKDYQIPYNYK